MNGPFWQNIAAIFIKFKMDVSPKREWIETAFTRWFKLKECKHLLRKTRETAEELRLNISANHNGIQALQDESNTRDVDIRKVLQELLEAYAATAGETQLI